MAETTTMAHPAKYAICASESIYSDALTRGKRYPILEISSDGKQIKLEGDNKRQRWFPIDCFDLEGGMAPLLARITVQDELEGLITSPVEVIVELSNGQSRWCFFVTPEILKAMAQFRVNAGTVNIYGAPHMVVVSVITKEMIEQALESIDRKGELEDCTLPVD